MAYYCYAHNFKLFRDSWIQLHKTAFATGPNSSGKSSFLELVSILLSEDFTYRQQSSKTNLTKTQFTSLHGKNSTEEEFTIGNFIVEDVPEPLRKYKSTEHGILITYSNVANTPTPTSHSVFIEDFFINFKSLPDNRVSYSTRNIKNITPQKFSKLHHSIEQGKIIKRDLHISELLPFDIIRQTFLLSNRETVISRARFANRFTKSHYSELMYGAGISRQFSDYRMSTPTRTLGDLNSKSDSLNYGSSAILLSGNPAIENFKSILNEFGQNSELYDQVAIAELSPVNDIYDLSNRAFWTFLRDDKWYFSEELGEGINQVMPLVFELVKDSSVFHLLQQPEIHLHPRAESAFGEFLFSLIDNEENFSFLAETHSDFIIDAFRRKALTTGKSDRFVIQFFEMENGKTNVYDITLNSDGSLSGAPPNYRSFFLKERLKNLSLI